MKNSLLDTVTLKNDFIKIYGESTYEVELFKSPARINVIGEYTDFNGGKVFPAAIDRYLYIAIRKRNDKLIHYSDLKFPEKFEFYCDQTFTYKKENSYANYLNGILTVFARKGYTLSQGFDILFCSDIPPAGGISSSSALESGFAYAVSELFGFNISRKDIALAGQQSEHEFMNVQCGIMDQFIISTAKKDTAELLDTETLDVEYVPFNLGDYKIVVMNTNKKRQLADSKYNERRSECEQAVKELNEKASLNINYLCQLTPQQYEKYCSLITQDNVMKRARHAITENDRVKKAVEALKANDLVLLGKYLDIAHASLKDDFEVTGIELDTITESARKQKGCLGSRMIGAGFGGCAIAIVHKDNIKDFMDNVQTDYLKKIGYPAMLFECNTSDGVSRL